MNSGTVHLRTGLRCRRGFTLIEILVVVVILGIMSAVILPQLGTRDDLSAASGARTLMADLLYAQNRAITLQQYHYVVFDTAGKKYTIYSGTSGGPTSVIAHPLTNANYQQVFGVAPLSKVSFGTVSFDGQTTLGFDQLGVPYSYSASTGKAVLGAGTVEVKCNANKMTITVKPYSGEILVQ